MNYYDWRQDVFGQNPDAEPASLDLLPETYACSLNESLDYIDRALGDPDIHSLYCRNQIGIALSLLYCNSCSNLPFCYVDSEVDEKRRIVAIRNLKYLYRNYFQRYCSPVVTDIGNDQKDGRIGYICYMLWDVFVLYPGNATPNMISESLGVMKIGLNSENESSVASAIHGLGHWVDHTPVAADILRVWLREPTTRNPEVIDYAKQGVSGCIL